MQSKSNEIYEHRSQYTPMGASTPDRIVSVPYVTQLGAETFINRVTGIQAGTGQGKTTLARDIWRVIWANNPQARLLILSRSREMVNQLARDFSKIGAPVMSYLDATDPHQLADYQCLAMCINSLGKIERDGEILIPDFLFVDESETLLRAIGDDTFNGYTETAVFRVYTKLVKTAPTILFADATLGELTLRRPRRLEREVTYICNDWQPENKKPACRYFSQRALSDQFRDMLEDDLGFYVSAWDSKSAATAEAQSLSALYGHDAVLLITADTINDPCVQAFIHNPDTEYHQYRVVLFTSVIGNGFDFQMPCEAMFVFQTNARFDAPNIVQMVGRFRQAETLFIYQPNTNAYRTTDWVSLYRSRIRSAINTQALNFEATVDQDWTLPQLSLSFNQTDQSLLGLTCYAEAMHNHSLNHLHAHTDYLLSRQWVVTGAFVDDSDEPTTANPLQERQQMVKVNKEAFSWMVSQAIPVTRPEFLTHVRQKTVTQEIRAGFIRHQVETGFHQRATPDLVHAFNEGKLRQIMAFIQYTENDIPEMMLNDFKEIVGHHALKKRHHHTRTQDLLCDFMAVVFGQEDFDPQIEIERLEMEKRVHAFMRKNGNDMRDLLDWRKSHSQDGVATVGRVLKSFGLTLKRRQVRKTDQTYYHIDADDLDEIRQYATAIQSAYIDDIPAANSESA